MKKNMTKDMVENLIHIITGGGTRYDFERIQHFDHKKLDRWFKRLLKKVR